MSATACPAETYRSPKRAAVLDAAGKLFLDNGYAAVSMDAVARQAGVSKATLYAYFTSKEALFAAVVANRCTAMAETLELAAVHDAPLDLALRRLGRHLLDFFLAPQVVTMFRIALGEGTRFPDLARAYYAAGPLAGRDRVTAWMEEEKRRFRLRADADPRLAAEHFISMLRGTVLLRGALGIPPTPSEAELDAAAAAAAEVIRRAYGAESGAEPATR
ncbi:TetR/AcrR family transcriptional regulator [Roseomonas sp. HJA6]|uniref:TetR/AcrR family transcriptional regulator n=1 Tax=Roseomonas alba TaxID=2846776 RepID=A0ABS7ACX4_9PROT|nr:TetR/AcrR family transcriptional regulator [Neoroseomonas alba]MBW6400156.1 TetR/AcrR family transcriptional regulator [Neoroseomonas alba]